MGRRHTAAIIIFLVSFSWMSGLMGHRAMAQGTQVEKTKTPYPSYSLAVSFDLGKNLLSGDAKIDFAAPGKVFVGGLDILSMTLDGKPSDEKPSGGFIRIRKRGLLEIRYEKVASGSYGSNPENPGAMTASVVSAKGISLTGNWYPSVSGLAFYGLSATVPANFSAISEADDISSVRTPAGKRYTFSFRHPLTGIDLIAGPYVVTKSYLGNVGVYTYFFPKDQDLAKEYIKYTKKYLAMFDKLLVPYPYKRFSVVENLLPTGLSMPTFTLMGGVVLRLPFIVKTSLGHEIGHQWWGNYVYADFSKGNWLEALNSWMTDYRFAKMRGKGLDYRKRMLADFQSYVTPKNDFPLRKFLERTSPASEAIGYGKGMMLFHMLKGIVGREVFYKSLKALIAQYKWKKASWADIQAIFERQSGKDLGWFFSQWLDRKEVPLLAVGNQQELVLNGIPQVSFELAQEGLPYRMTLPVTVVTGTKEKTENLQVEKPIHTYNVVSTEEQRPSSLVIDGNYDVMRHLSPGEFAPSIARLLGSPKRLLVYRAADKDKYSSLIDVFAREGFTVKEEKDLKESDMEGSSFLVLGFDSPVLKRLFGGLKSPSRGLVFTVKENPLNPENVVAMVQASSKSEVDQAAYKIPHYGQYQTLGFEGGKNIEKKTGASKNGMIFKLSNPVPAIQTSGTIHLGNIVDEVSSSPVIFIGERHANYEDHEVELDVIMALHRMGKKFAIGMEMFQIPYQKYIDDFISKKIDEREFLKKTQYFTRWGFDYNYYRQILEYARAKDIPVIALNIQKEITDKVAKGGLDALSPKELKEIPATMDMSNAKYRKMLREIYMVHPQGIGFDNFYQAQILWDESMARSVAEFTEKNPGSQMVVMAGAGHIMNGYGIPDRFARRTGKKYVTLINGTYSFDPDIADYVLFPQPQAPPASGKLGVLIGKKKGAEIVGFVPGSPAKEAGLRKGDRIIAIDGWEVGSVADAKIALFDKLPGQTVTVKVVRKRFLFGSKTITVKVTL